MEKRLKNKSAALIETSRAVVISSKICDIDAVDNVSREERKREASKPLYLVRYE